MRNMHLRCLMRNAGDFSIYFTNLFKPTCKEYLTKFGVTGSNPGKSLWDPRDLPLQDLWYLRVSVYNFLANMGCKC